MNTNRKILDERRLAFSPVEVARKLGLSLTFIRAEIRQGKLKSRRAGRRVLVLRSDLESYLER